MLKTRYISDLFKILDYIVYRFLQVIVLAYYLGYLLMMYLHRGVVLVKLVAYLGIGKVLYLFKEIYSYLAGEGYIGAAVLGEYILGGYGEGVCYLCDYPFGGYLGRLVLYHHFLDDALHHRA